MDVEVEREKFIIPKKRLQKPVLLIGTSPEENAVEYVNLRRQRGIIRYKKKPFTISDFCDLSKIAASKQKDRALDALHGAINKTNEAYKIVHKALGELEERKAYINEMIVDLHSRCLDNIKNREEDKVDCMTKVTAYLGKTKEFQAEKEKQDILVRIGFIVEALHNELEPYEELLGNLALQESSFKSKADTLSIRKDILMERRQDMIEKLHDILIDEEESRKALFQRIFNLRESTHAALNTVNKLQEKEVKTMRTVLDKENRLSTIRKRGQIEESEKARFYWFLDWVLTDIIGLETIAEEITLSSSPEDKCQTIIEYYKNLKSFTTNLPLNRNTHLVEMIF